MPKSRSKRIEAITAELDSHQIASNEESRLASVVDNELFTIDTIGSKSARKKIENCKISAKNIDGPEKKFVSKLTEKKRKRQAVVSIVAHNSLYDLWDCNEISSPTNTRNPCNKLHRKVKVPVGGLSYNPSINDHQDAIAEATALEIRRREMDLRDHSFSSGRSQTEIQCVEDFAAIPFDTDDFDTIEGDLLKPSSLTHRRPKPLTRVQKNKKRLRSVIKQESLQEKVEASILKSIDRLPIVLKSIEMEEEHRTAVKSANLLKKTVALDSTAMTYDEAGLVPLTDELSGSMRTIIPKGCCIVDRVKTMTRVGDVTNKSKRKRRAYEKPQTGKNIKWFPKYKY